MRGELSRYKLLMRYCALKAARHRDSHGSRLNSRGMQGGQECWSIRQESCGPLLVKESDGWDFLVDCIHRHETGAFPILASFFLKKVDATILMDCFLSVDNVAVNKGL